MRVVVGGIAALVVLSLSVAAQTPEKAPVTYRVSFPAPEHRFAQVEVTFPLLPSTPLEARMSRSSPGRYALHEFAKNVYDVHAFNSKGQELAVTRPNPYQWDVAGHDGTVRVTYKVYGDHVDGTYLGIDTTHAHMNLPATLMWARHLEDRPAVVTFVPPDGSNWKPATQLFPGATPWTFTAPNLQYLFDSPTELSAYTLRQFTVHNPDGQAFTIRAAVHSDASVEEIDRYASGVEKIVNEAMAVYREFPQYEPGTYTFLADYLPYDSGDGMEHRNSTVVTGRSLSSALSTVSHEFFHCWNVERIRPQGLEPFNFEEANMTDSLWLAEGFTQYYGSLIMARAGLLDVPQAVGQLGRLAAEVVNQPGRQLRSAVDMSRMAPFVDAARAVDRTNFSTTFISYYTYGGAIALALDLTLRDRSNGQITLDDFMRAMWRHVRRAGRPAARSRGQTLFADRRSRSDRGSERRRGVRRRLLQSLYRWSRGRRLRSSPEPGRGGVAHASRRTGLARRCPRRSTDEDRSAGRPGDAGLRRRARAGRCDYRSEWEGDRDAAAASGRAAYEQTGRSADHRLHAARRPEDDKRYFEGRPERRDRHDRIDGRHAHTRAEGLPRSLAGFTASQALTDMGGGSIG